VIAPHLRAKVELVALTGLGQEANRRRAYEVGYRHVFLKTVDPELLHDLLRSVPPGRGAALYVERQPGSAAQRSYVTGHLPKSFKGGVSP
jgi:hypothetical protein